MLNDSTCIYSCDCVLNFRPARLSPAPHLDNASAFVRSGAGVFFLLAQAAPDPDGLQLLPLHQEDPQEPAAAPRAPDRSERQPRAQDLTRGPERAAAMPESSRPRLAAEIQGNYQGPGAGRRKDAQP